MQYILTEREYKALKNKQKLDIELQEAKLQTLCTKIANDMPIKWGWGSPDPKPWTCILTAEDEWYCDSCPVQEICPNEWKHWSK
jgi:hypothetical protein